MYGLKFVGAGKSSVLLYSMPLWSSIFAVKFLEEKFTITKLIGLLFGILGVLTIIGWNFWVSQDKNAILREILIIIAAISWGISNIYFRLRLNNLPKLETSAYQMLFGTIIIIIVTLLTEWHEPIILNVYSIYYILFTGILASALSFTIWYVILSLINIITATILTLLVPVFGLFFSFVLLNENLTGRILVGTGMVIISIIIVQIKVSSNNWYVNTKLDNFLKVRFFIFDRALVI